MQNFAAHLVRLDAIDPQRSPAQVATGLAAVIATAFLLIVAAAGLARAQSDPAPCGVFHPSAPGVGAVATLTPTPKGFVGPAQSRSALLVYNSSWGTVALAPRPAQPAIGAPSSLTIPPASSRTICGADAAAEWSGLTEIGSGNLIFWEITK